MKDVKNLLETAAQEITTLSSQNHLMSARLEMFDTMMRLFHTVPNWPSQGGMSPDIVYEINKTVASLESEKNKAS